MTKKTRTKEIKFPMKFNPGTMKYGPELPLRKKKAKIKFKWWAVITLIIIILIITIGALLALKYGLLL